MFPPQQRGYNPAMDDRRYLGKLRVSPLIAASLWCALHQRHLALAADEVTPLPVERQVETALHSVLLVAGVLVVLILVAIAIIVYRKVFTVPPAETPGPAADPLVEAEMEIKRGNFAAAAARFEAGGEMLRAGECWEKASDFTRAAECLEAGGDLERAAQLHVRSGGALRAAGIYMRAGNHIEAAKIFRNKGDHLRAAQALELYGNRRAAAREYAEAGNHARAARLLEQEKLYAEAAAAFHPLLGGSEVTAANADAHSRHAVLLALAGEKESAVATLRRVLAALPEHQRARAALQDLLPRAPESAPEGAAPSPAAPPPAPLSPGRAKDQHPEPGPPATARTEPPPADVISREIEADAALDQGDPLKRVFTLRSMIGAGRMEPRYSMRLWVQVMRALAERHRAGVVLGCLTPDSIVIDMENNVRIDPPQERPAAYLSPEVQAGRPPDRQADIYSMGVILYELVTGAPGQFGRKRAGEMFADVPPWLDELIVRCTEKDPAKRYRTAEEVSAALLKLKTAAPE